MGGNKQQRSIGSTDKVNDNAQGGDQKLLKRKTVRKRVQNNSKDKNYQYSVEDSQGTRLLQNMKAITIQGFARSAGVKISVANSFIKSAESKGLVRNVGGYSGHRVYELVK